MARKVVKEQQCDPKFKGGKSSQRRDKSPKGSESEVKGRHDRMMENELEHSQKKYSNDPSWHVPLASKGSADSEMAAIATNIPFSIPLGGRADMALYSATHGFKPVADTKGIYSTLAIPGVCAISVIPGFGPSYGPTSPLNTAANELNVFLRSKNSRQGIYDASDVICFVGAASNIFAAVTWAKRLLDESQLYKFLNTYLPDTLFKAEGIDGKDLVSNFADYSYRLNNIIAKLNKVVIPDVFPLFKYHSFLFSSLYVEGNSIKDQIYMYVPSGFYQLRAYTPEQPDSNLTFIRRTESGTFGSLLDLLDSLIAPLIQWSDNQYIAADIMNAYPESALIRVSPYAYTPITPVYDEMVLTQMKNATLVGVVSSTGVYQSADKSYLISTPQAHALITENQTQFGNFSGFLTNEYASNRLLTIDGSSPDMGTYFDISRLTATCSVHNGLVVDGKKLTGTFINGSTVLAEFMKIYTNVWSDDRNGEPVPQYQEELSYSYIMNIPVSTSLEVLQDMRYVTRLQSFKYHPPILPFYQSVLATTDPATHNDVWALGAFAGWLVDVDNYAILNSTDLERIHNVALRTEYGVGLIDR